MIMCMFLSSSLFEIPPFRSPALPFLRRPLSVYVVCQNITVSPPLPLCRDSPVAAAVFRSRSPQTPSLITGVRRSRPPAPAGE